MTHGNRGGIHFPLGAGTPTDPEGLGLPSTSKRGIDPEQLAVVLRETPGVGRVTAGRFAALGIQTVGDLLLHVPFRHEPPARLAPIATIRAGEEATLRARVVSCAVRRTGRRGLKVLEALVSDDSGSVVAVWFNQDYLAVPFADNPEVLLRGSLAVRAGRHVFTVKRHEILSSAGEEEGVHTLGLVPVYPATGDLSVRTIRATLKRIAPRARHLVDPLPSSLIAARGYAGLPEAVLAYHFPRSMREAERARARLAFEELLLLQLVLLRRRLAQDLRRRAQPLPAAGDLTGRFVAGLPFVPTRAQLRVLAEIEVDLGRSVPMRRLLQGDVGSGKTMVATWSLLRAVEAGSQAALMVPTEVLAQQHYERLAAQLAPLGVVPALLRGSQPASERRAVRRRLESGDVSLVVGTHALVQEDTTFRDLRVAVVDEQHRFGVRQRDALARPADDERRPHVLHMTATPIPRTLSLTLYGDLDLSVIDELPPGRTPVRTRLVFPEQRARLWQAVRRELDRGRQAYVVCPLIDESESLAAASAKAVYEELTGGELATYRLRLLHGQLPAAAKHAAMASFAAGDVDVLVSTTVIEVGVDVANACVMVIEDARRFGLSQLHQLRGRVGRGSAHSACFLLADRDDPVSLERLALFARTNDGFVLAEADLRGRGEGQLFGERQSGLGDLRVARLLRDGALLDDARRTAGELLADDPALTSAALRLLGEAAQARFGASTDWFDRA